MKKTIMKFLGLAALCGLGLSAMADVAKVGDMGYPTIDEAIAAWGPGKTLKLLQDVTLSDTVVVEMNATKSSSSWTLDLGDYTMTAATGKDAIKLFATGGTQFNNNNGLKIKATEKGGVNAANNRVVAVEYSPADTRYRPRLEFNGGHYVGSYIVQYGTASWGSYYNSCAATHGPGTYFNKGTDGKPGVYDGKVVLCKSLVQVNAGTFNGDEFSVYPVSSTGDTYIYGGKFKSVPTPYNNKGIFKYGDGIVYFYDNDGYYEAVTKASISYEASLPKGHVLKKTSFSALGYNDASVYFAVANVAVERASSEVTLYADADADKSFSSSTSTMFLENGAKYTGTITLGTSAKLVVKDGVDGFVGKVVCSNPNYFAKKTNEGSQYTYSCLSNASCPVKVVDPSGVASYYVERDEANAAIAAATSGSTIEFRDGTYTAAKTLGKDETLTLVFKGGAYDYECLVKGAAGYSVEFDVNGSTVVAKAVHDESKAQASTEGEGGEKQSYDTVKEAVEQAASGETVKLNPEATKESAPIEVGEGKQTAIDLNGGGIEAAPTGGDAAVKVAGGAELVIGDSSADGKGVVSAGDPEKTVVKVEEGSKATIEGGTYVGKLEVAEGATLVIKDGTFTDNPSEYIDPALKSQGQVAKLSEDHSVWTVGEGEVKASAEIPETGAVTDKEGKTVEPTETQQEAIDEVKQEIVAAVTTDDAVAGATTGINGVTKDENGNLTQAIINSIKGQAAGQPGVDAEVIEKIGENGVSSNFLNIAVKTVDVVVEGDGAKPATIVYEVTPKIETTVVKDDGTEVKVTTTVPNDEVAKKPMSFNLKVTDPTAQIAFVKHTGEGFDPEDLTCKVWEKDGKRYITVTVSHFSLFGVTYSSEVVVECEETVVIVKVEKPEAGEVAFGVPFAKGAGANATFAELLVAGAATGDKIRTFDSEGGDYADTLASATAVPGTAFWYDRVAASDIPLAVGGLVKDGLAATGAAGAENAPKMTLFMNPYRDEVDAKTVVSMMHAGDEIAVEGGKVRYAYDGSKWTVKATGAAAASIPVPAGKTFWYVSKGGAAQVAW